MPGGTLFTATVIFAIIAGTAAGVLSVLAFEVFRHSPFGRAVLVLSFMLVLFILYHTIIVLVPDLAIVAQGFKSVVLTSAAVFIWIMAWSQFQMVRRTDPGGDVG